MKKQKKKKNNLLFINKKIGKTPALKKFVTNLRKQATKW